MYTNCLLRNLQKISKVDQVLSLRFLSFLTDIHNFVHLPESTGSQTNHIVNVTQQHDTSKELKFLCKSKMDENSENISQAS